MNMAISAARSFFERLRCLICCERVRCLLLPNYSFLPTIGPNALTSQIRTRRLQADTKPPSVRSQSKRCDH